METLPSDIFLEISKHLDYFSLYNLKYVNTVIILLISDNELISKIDRLRISTIGTNFCIIKLFSNNIYCNSKLYEDWNTLGNINEFIIFNLKKFKNITQVDLYFNKEPNRKVGTSLWLFEIVEILKELPSSVETINFYKFYHEGEKYVSSYLIKCLNKFLNLKKVGLNSHTLEIEKFKRKYMNIKFTYLQTKE